MIRSLQPQPLADTASRIALTKTHTIIKIKADSEIHFKKWRGLLLQRKQHLNGLPQHLVRTITADPSVVRQ